MDEGSAFVEGFRGVGFYFFFYRGLKWRGYFF